MSIAAARPNARPTRLRRVDGGEAGRPRLEERRRRQIEDARRRQLMEATVDAIAEVGFNATTITQIARRADVSTGLVSFYFGDKDGLLEATLRHLARQLSMGAAIRLRDARTPRDRIQAIIDAMLGASQFERGIATVWLAFWGQVPHSPRFARVQRAYQRRLVSNLAHALRPLVDRPAALRMAEAIAAMIDGLWLRATLSHQPHNGAARDLAGSFVDGQFALLGLPGGLE